MKSKDNLILPVKLAEKKEKRKQYELKLKLKALQLPEHDIRRSLLQNLMKLYSCRDFRGLKRLLDASAVPQMLIRFTFLTSNNLDPFILPNRTEIRGSQNIVNFMKAISRAMPDDVYIISNILVRCGFKGSSIHGNFTMAGTAVYDVLLNTSKSVLENSNIRDPKKKKADCDPRNDELIQINLSNLSNGSEESVLNMSEQGNNSLEQEIYTFENSDVKKDVKTYTGDGVAVLYLNSDHKLHLFELTVQIKTSAPFFKNRWKRHK